MACLILKGPQGKRLIHPDKDGRTYIYKLFPGEKISGIDKDCSGNEPVPVKRELPKDLMTELNEEIGEGAGNWLKRFAAPIAKLVGKEKCSSCETRRIVTNAYAKLKAKHGQAEALRIIGALWKDSFSISDDEVLTKLKEFLA